MGEPRPISDADLNALHAHAAAQVKPLTGLFVQREALLSLIARVRRAEDAHASEHALRIKAEEGRDAAFALLHRMGVEYDRDEECDNSVINGLIEHGQVLVAANHFADTSTGETR